MANEDKPEQMPDGDPTPSDVKDVLLSKGQQVDRALDIAEKSMTEVRESRSLVSRMVDGLMDLVKGKKTEAESDASPAAPASRQLPLPGMTATGDADVDMDDDDAEEDEDDDMEKGNSIPDGLCKGCSEKWEKGDILMKGILTHAGLPDQVALRIDTDALFHSLAPLTTAAVDDAMTSFMAKSVPTFDADAMAKGISAGIEAAFAPLAARIQEAVAADVGKQMDSRLERMETLAKGASAQERVAVPSQVPSSSVLADAARAGAALGDPMNKGVQTVAPLATKEIVAAVGKRIMTEDESAKAERAALPASRVIEIRQRLGTT